MTEWLKGLWDEQADCPVLKEWRRVEKRRVAFGLVEINCDEDIFNCKIRDVSLSGLGLISKIAIKQGYVLIRLLDQEIWHSMVIVHCTQTIGGYKIGLGKI